jgi:hypothetical protein
MRGPAVNTCVTSSVDFHLPATLLRVANRTVSEAFVALLLVLV